MYGNLTSTTPVGRRPKSHKNQSSAVFAPERVLTQSLQQSLRQGLYEELFQGYTYPNHVTAISSSGTVVTLPTNEATALVAAIPTTAVSSTIAPPSGVTIRRIGLLAGESVSMNFTPEEGLVSDTPEEGRLLVLTNLRLMAFGQHDGMKETVLLPVEEVKAAAVNAGVRSKGTLLQGVFMVAAAVFFYVLLAYWLTGRIDGPTVPIIRMDLVAFIVFLAVLSGVGMLAQIYFGKPDGEVTFQGDGVKIGFPFKGESAEEDMLKLVNAAFAARQAIVAKVGVRSSGAGFSGLNTD